MRGKNTFKHFFRDVLIITASILVAIYIAKHDGISEVINSEELSPLYSTLIALFAGSFFTSIFTLAPASVVLIELREHLPSLTISILGGLGATCIDVLIASFVRKNVYYGMKNLPRFSLKWHFISLFHFGFLKWASFILGLIVIASPLPDELGLFFVAISKVKPRYLPIVFFMANAIGIYILISAAEKFI